MTLLTLNTHEHLNPIKAAAPTHHPTPPRAHSDKERGCAALRTLVISHTASNEDILSFKSCGDYCSLPSSASSWLSGDCLACTPDPLEECCRTPPTSTLPPAQGVVLDKKTTSPTESYSRASTTYRYFGKPLLSSQRLPLSHSDLTEVLAPHGHQRCFRQRKLKEGNEFNNHTII